MVDVSTYVRTWEPRITPSSPVTTRRLTSALGRLLAIAENYPNLKADQNFIRLQDELAGTENRIAVARKDYNDTVRGFNTMVLRFPGSLAARLFGWQAHPYFEAEQGKKEVPKVSF